MTKCRLFAFEILAVLSGQMALFKFKNSKNWWYEFQFNGERIRATSKSQSKTVAREAMRAHRRRLEEGFHGISQNLRPQTLHEAAAEFIKAKTEVVSERTLAGLRYYLDRHVLPALGNRFVRDLTAEDLKALRRHKLAEGASPRTANMVIEPLRSILIRQKCWEKIKTDFQMLPVPETPGVALEPAQENQILRACKRSRSLSLFYAVLLALCTGLRLNEIKTLRWMRLNLAKRFLIVGESKTPSGTDRRIPLNTRALSALKGWAQRFPDRQPGHYLFPSERYGAIGNRFKNWRPKAYHTDPNRPLGSWKKAWTTVRKQTGIKCRFHDLRHTACTRMLEGGTPLPVVSSIMGWSASTTVLMTKRYGHIGQASFSKAVNLLNGEEIRTRRKKAGKHGRK